MRISGIADIASKLKRLGGVTAFQIVVDERLMLGVFLADVWTFVLDPFRFLRDSNGLY